MITEQELNRTLWAARRGMLELDLLLEPFVRHRYASLGEGDRQRFQRLLHCEDQQLYAWFLQRERPEEEELQRIVTRVLEFARGGRAGSPDA